MGLIQQPGDGSGDGDIVSEVGDQIEVTLDRWSAGQFDVADLVVAVAVLVVGALLAWLLSRVVRRLAERTTGAARAAMSALALLVGSSVMLLAAALALEILGFSLGPILILILMFVIALLLLRPTITNLTSGLLLELHGALAAGDLVRTNGVLGTVREINTRSVVLDTADGRRAHVPNADVLGDTVENYTALGRRRSSFDIVVGSDADLDVLTAAVLDAIDPVEAVLRDPPPEVQLHALAGQLVVVRVYVWHAPEASAARAALDAGLRAVVSAVDDRPITFAAPQWMALDLASGPSTGGSPPGTRT